jgi:hypothetical protein
MPRERPGAISPPAPGPSVLSREFTPNLANGRIHIHFWMNFLASGTVGLINTKAQETA